MPSGVERRARAPGTSRNSVRAKEAAELSRVTAAQGALPPLSAAFVPPRPNRRQRAAAAAAEAASNGEAGKTAPVPARTFSDLPLSTRTRDGLAASRFVDLTDVQRLAIPQALAARDVLAAAPTGSGKTLAFVVPVLEALWRQKWSTYDGLGALVLAPTRELALQIFEVFRSVAKFHMISAGLVIGGKDFEYERGKVARMNVLVATPGRLLHHMDCVPDFDCSTLQVLVLDEADRILDLGFSRTLSAILDNLPTTGRQTLLFSATQTKSIKALARLSLRSPQYVSVSSALRLHGTMEEETSPRSKKSDKRQTDCERDIESDSARSAGKLVNGAEAEGSSTVDIVGTPAGLSQSYTVVELHDKLSVLWSFIKTHLNSKVIVFLATGKQVRFVFEAFCKLRPGISLLHIHGNMKQLKRTDMYDSFCRTKSAVLFATDVASRGLDFPDVEWVVQADCPDDVSGYIHRVGRTARFRSKGRAMLLVGKGNEENFLKRLESRKIHLHETRINPERVSTITPRLASLVASNQELKNVAQRAFVFYLKSVYRQQDKEVFNAVETNHAAFAASLGLALAPKVTFKGGSSKTNAVVSKDAKPDGKTVFGYRQRGDTADRVDAKPEDLGLSDAALKKHTLQESRSKNGSSEDDGQEDVLVVKRTHPPGEDGVELSEDSELAAPVPRKRKRIKLDLLKTGPSANRVVFTDDGHAIGAKEAMQLEVEGLNRTESGVEELKEMTTPSTSVVKDIDGYAAIVAERLEASAVVDKAREHDRVRAKHVKAKDRSRGKLGDKPTLPQQSDSGSDDASDDASDDDDDDVDDDFANAVSRIASRSGASLDLSDSGDIVEAGESRTNADNSDSEADSAVVGPEQDELAAYALELLQKRRGRYP